MIHFPKINHGFIFSVNILFRCEDYHSISKLLIYLKKGKQKSIFFIFQIWYCLVLAYIVIQHVPYLYDTFSRIPWNTDYKIIKIKSQLKHSDPCRILIKLIYPKKLSTHPGWKQHGKKTALKCRNSISPQSSCFCLSKTLKINNAIKR